MSIIFIYTHSDVFIRIIIILYTLYSILLTYIYSLKVTHTQTENENFSGKLLSYSPVTPFTPASLPSTRCPPAQSPAARYNSYPSQQKTRISQAACFLTHLPYGPLARETPREIPVDFS